jgi:membrane associated rhomboid family serine protease
MLPLADHNPTRTKPVVTWVIIATCVVAFLGQLGGPNGFGWSVAAYGFIPARLFAGLASPVPGAAEPAVTLLTSMFLHGGVMHLLGNMLYLHIFGDNIENDLGRPRYLLLYIAAGLAAAMAQALPGPSSSVPMIGASGAISGILGAYLVLHPRQPVTVLVPNYGLTRMPAMLVLGLWFAYQLLYGFLGGNQGGGVAFWAHVGGFVAGVALIKPLMLGRPR